MRPMAPAGSPFAAQTPAETSRAAGLPFAGIPPELGARVAAIEAREPAHAVNVVMTRPDIEEREPFSLVQFLAPHRARMLLSLLLVSISALASQAGPRLLTW